MGTVVKVLGLGLVAFIGYRVVVAMRAGAPVAASLRHPTLNVHTLAATAAAEMRANQGAGHF
jgi:hypothetical protein